MRTGAGAKAWRHFLPPERDGVSWRRSRRLNISAYPSENFAHVTILNNAETIRHLWKVDILEMGVSPGFCLSKACCLYADRLDDNRIALVGR